MSNAFDLLVDLSKAAIQLDLDPDREAGVLPAQVALRGLLVKAVRLGIEAPVLRRVSEFVDDWYDHPHLRELMRAELLRIMEAEKDREAQPSNGDGKKSDGDGPWATSKIICANSKLRPHQISSRAYREKDIRSRPPKFGKHPERNCRDVELAFPDKANGLVNKILALKP